ncbi:MAG: ABC transporter ATP-binding protein [Bacteroidota bacterium]
MNAVESVAISKTYRNGVFKRTNIQALKEVSIAVEAGEIFGLLGPNGAGKTTFVKLLLSIVHPTSGTATVLGKPIGTDKVKEYCGYLPENHRYPGFLSGRDTLLFFGRLNGLSEALMRDRIPTLLELVGLKDWAGLKTKKYSKGMLQRLGLAQALINDPQVLFLDEPTDGVDPIGRKEIRDILVGLKKKGTTIFLNSHLLSEVEAVCDRVAILNKGSVVKVGTISELTVQQLSYELHLDRLPSTPLMERLSSIAKGISVNQNVLVLVLGEKSDLNNIVDLLRGEEIAIESMTQQKTTLEDSFIKLIKTDGQG